MSEKVYVWDKFVRSFHWSLVALFAISYVSAEEIEWLHVYSGYTIAGLVVLRLIWGVIGTRHARFTDFVPSVSVTKAYISGIRSGKPKHYLGHNPLGGLMVVAFLVMLALITLSGMKLYAVTEGKGPLAAAPQIHLISPAYADDDDHEGRGEGEGDEFWKDIHELAVNLMVLLILLHVAGVVISSRIHNESLVKSMLDGYKEKH
ncbi:cytochrome b/b6 domain-containing protein [uncultured Amphritea sp.]|uniref:cytochrome b/b6 domain-containing protein n=1 Tax=uncultured Amphritea sp. TaxID=981605 RepID=UPI00262078EA|nr:cytochrome b/b6 domain-containing protein [uncultured Amphritea sp.]